MTPATVPSATLPRLPDRDLPTVGISMHDDVVRLEVCRRLDLEATIALVDAVDAAVLAGATVLIDLRCDGGRLPPADEVVTAHPGTDTVGRLDVRGSGYVQLAADGSCWMIDLVGARLCRGAGRIDPCFVASTAWTPIDAIWIARESVHALTTEGDYLTRAVRWSPGGSRPAGEPRASAA